MDEPFDAELIKRLRNYSEEPRMELWQKIVASAEANRSRVRHKRLGSTWILILGVIAVGGLYYLERTKYLETAKSNVNGATGLSASVSSVVDKDEIGEISTESLVSRNSTTKTSDFSSEQSAGANVTTAGNKVWLSQDGTQLPGYVASEGKTVIANKETFRETNANQEEDKFEAGFVEDPTTQGNEIEDVDNRSIEKEAPTTATKKVPKDDEGKTVIQEKEKRNNKFSIYFTIMPTFGYQRIKANSSDDLFIESVKRISTFSTDRLGVRAELGVEDPITQRIKVFGGLVYYQRKQTIDYTEKQVEFTVTEGPGGEVRMDTTLIYDNKSFEYELKNLGVQIGVSYELSRKKLLQTVGTGFEFHIALNELEPSQAAEFTNNPSAYVFYNLYYRLQYPAEGRLKAVFQPTLNYSFYINQNLNAPFYVKPYGLGLNLGFTYNF